MRLEERRPAGKTAKKDGWRDLALGRHKGQKKGKKAARTPEMAERSVQLYSISIPDFFRFLLQVLDSTCMGDSRNLHHKKRMALY